MLSLIKVTTIGYGSIPVVTNWERIYAMIVMAAGAVICDAGITAILTSIISMRDQQAGSNSRRIRCSERYMKTFMIDKDLRERVLSFYEYTDVELENIDEGEILSNLSSNLRNEILHHFCFSPLRTSSLANGMSDGAVRTLVDMMNPYLAIPGEKLTDMDEECKSIFVLKSGIINAKDSAGYESLVALGSVIGHDESTSKSSLFGMPNKVLIITLISAQSLKVKMGNPYFVLKVGPYNCRSEVKKTRNWDEEIMLKMNGNIEKNLTIIVKAWEKKQSHPTIGTLSIQFDETQSEVQNLVVNDAQGRSVGILRLKLKYRDMTKSELLINEKYSTFARSYCHLYQISSSKYLQFKQYLDSSKKPHLEERLSGPFLKNQGQHVLLIDVVEREQPLSKQSVFISAAKQKSLIMTRKAFDHNSTLSIYNNDGKARKEIDESKRKNKNIFTFFQAGRRTSSVHPEKPAAAEDEEQGSRKESSDDSTWRGSNSVRTGTFSQVRKGTEEVESSQLNHISESERQWDILVDMNNENSVTNSVFIEWVEPVPP